MDQEIQKFKDIAEESLSQNDVYFALVLDGPTI